jgi:hypothetical protein
MRPAPGHSVENKHKLVGGSDYKLVEEVNVICWLPMQVVQRMMGAFEGRCRQLYGPSSLHAKRRAVGER